MVTSIVADVPLSPDAGAWTSCSLPSLDSCAKCANLQKRQLLTLQRLLCGGRKLDTLALTFKHDAEPVLRGTVVRIRNITGKMRLLLGAIGILLPVLIISGQCPW